MFLIHAGDVCYSKYYNSWKKDLFIPEFQDLASGVPFYTAIGNHEGWHTNTKAFLQAPQSASKEKYFYSFELGDVFFLVLSSEHSTDDDSKQYEYAARVLGATQKKWKIVVFHKSAYCGCPHGDIVEFRELTDSVLAPNKVDIVINGHSHFYQRNYVQGIYHFILGGAGSGLHTPQPAEYTQKTVEKHHFAIFDIDKNVLKMNVFDLDGMVIDSLEIKK